MKLFRNIMIASSALLLSLAVSCEQEPVGKGDATIGFAKETYVYKESAGLVKIPVQFTGEPKTYPISFDIVAEVEGGAFKVEDLVHFTQTKGLKYAGNPEAPAFIEIEIYDNQEINDSRFINLSIENVKGATLAGTGKAVLELADNDNNPYERLMGTWVAKDNSGKSWECVINGGFSTDEETVNFEKTLVCWGFGGQMVDTQGAMTPTKQPVWYLRYNAEEESLYTMPGELMANIWSFDGIDEDCEVKFATGTVKDGKLSTDHELPIRATWSEDMNTITFQTGYYLTATVWGVSGVYYGYWMAFGDVVMTRK